jgi:hypothetical protein
MRKRRVGVTARSRLIVGNQATGTPQIATEIAAPLVSRTPTGTVATATSECGWKRGDTTGVKDNRAESSSGEMRIREESRTQGRRTSAPKAARMRRCLILRQGASPLRPPAPFPSDLIIRKGGGLSRVRCAGQIQAALDRPPPFRTKLIRHEGKGALGARRLSCLPLVGSQPTQPSRPSPRENYLLDSGRPSHGSRDRPMGRRASKGVEDAAARASTPGTGATGIL